MMTFPFVISVRFQLSAVERARLEQIGNEIPASQRETLRETYFGVEVTRDLGGGATDEFFE
jgi:hypothetical protein